MTSWILRLALLICAVSLLALGLTRLTDIPQGDPQHGGFLYDGASRPYLGCFQCHEYSNIAPRMGDLSARVRQERLAIPANAGETVEEYLAASIIDPKRYVVPGYPDNLMPVNYGQRLSVRDLQDIVAYLMTL